MALAWKLTAVTAKSDTAPRSLASAPEIALLTVLLQQNVGIATGRVVSPSRSGCAQWILNNVASALLAPYRLGTGRPDRCFVGV